jgi:hypothetical protein
VEKKGKMSKRWITIKIDEQTREELVRFRAWLEITTGRRLSLNETIKEMATRLNNAVTIPWEALK